MTLGWVTLKKNGKVAGGFTRGGDPSTLLKAGFSMVALGNDTFDLTGGASSIMTGGISTPRRPPSQPTASRAE